MANHNYLLENNPGRAVRNDFNGGVTALASNNSGGTEPPTPYPGMLWLDLSVLPNGIMRERNLANTGWVAMSGAPAKAGHADVIAGTDDSMYITPEALDDWIDSRPTVVANRLVNPAMQIAQDAAASATTGLLFAADQWYAVGAGGTTYSVAQFQSRTPRGSPDRIRLVATAAKTVLAATDQAELWQNIEGLRIADLAFGTAKAKPVIVRFGFKAPAGNYTFALRNGTTRCYLRLFTITAAQANKDTEQVLVIPGDVTGAWASDNSRAMQFLVNVACGANYVNASINTWLAGEWLGAGGGSNGLAVAGNTFELFDCGLYEDVSGKGTPPIWQYPDYGDTLLACQRYYISGLYVLWSGSATNGFAFYGLSALPTEMRINTPSLSGINSNATNFPAAVGTLVAFNNQNLGIRAIRENRTANATGAGGLFATTVTANARM